MNKRLRTMFALFLLASASALWGADVSTDRFLGRWVLDTAASTYPAKTCPQSMTIEMTSEGEGVRYHSITVPRSGHAFEAEYLAKYDGKPALVTGTRGVLLPVTLRKESGTVVIATYSNGFAVMASSRRTLSDRGNTMTITTVSQDGSGLMVTNTGVYRRVEHLPAASFDLSKTSKDLPSFR